MFKNYLITSLRNILRYKYYSLLNILCLGLGMASFILISLWVMHEYSYDRYHDNAANIYCVCQEFEYYFRGKNRAPITPGPLARALEAEFPEIISATRLIDDEDVLLINGNQSYLEDNFFFADPQTFEIFSFEFLRGNPGTALNDPYSMIISRSIAEKYFGEQDPLGKTISYKGKNNFTITAVIEDAPANSQLKMNFIIPFDTYAMLINEDIDNWGMASFYTYILVNDGVDPHQIESKLPALITKYGSEGNSEQDSYFLRALTDLHLYSDDLLLVLESGNINAVLTFSLIALLILIVSCINYINLATARYTRRYKEIGIRKIIGAGKSNLLMQLLIESTVMAIIALLVALFIVELALPYFSSMLAGGSDSQFAVDYKGLAIFLVMVIAIGLLAGLYPALRIAAVKPIYLINSQIDGKFRKVSIRNALVVFQFAVSVILILCTVIMQKQLNYVRTWDVGYQKDHIIVLEMLDREARDKFDAIKIELLKDPDITAVSGSSCLPNNVGWQTSAKWPGKPEDLDIPIYVGVVDYDFIDLYGIGITEGRGFSRDFPSDASGAFLINEAALNAFGWQTAVGRDFTHRTHFGTWPGEIVGVMKNFNLHSLHQKIAPLYLYLEPQYLPQKSNYYLSVKIKPTNIPLTLTHIEETIKSFSPQYPFSYQFFDEVFDRFYKSEQKLAALLRVFSILAISIACLGLLGLVSFSIESRVKEIGIRKVLGASAGRIITHIMNEFWLLIIIANAIAWPIAYFAMHRWLEDFAYRTDINFLIFLAGALISLTVATLTMGIRALKAAMANPVNSLRHE